MKGQKNIAPWNVKSSKVVLEDPWIKVRADECVTADGIIISPYYVLDYPNGVVLVVINDKNQVLITQQYRHGLKDSCVELPCGTQDSDDRSPLKAAKRELLEETGYTGDFVLVGKVSPNPATHSNTIHAFLVTNPVKKSQSHYDPKEVLDYEFLSMDQVYELIDQGEFRQALHISGLMLGLRKHQMKQHQNEEVQKPDILE